MLTLTDKIGIRAGTLWAIFAFIKPSMWVIAMVITSLYKFTQYGLVMYGGHFPQKMSLHQYLQIFVERSVTPLLLWWVGAVLIELILLRPMYYKYIVSRASA